MSWRLGFVTLLVPGIIIFIVAMGAIFLQQLRSGEATQRSVGIAAEAVLKSPSGELLGTATFRQGATGVLIMAEVTGLTPGGHAFVIHESGACTPDFGAAGDHFNPGETEHGFITSGMEARRFSWRARRRPPQYLRRLGRFRARRLLYPRHYAGQRPTPFYI